MKPALYIETTIPSYLVARKSRIPLIAGQQSLTRAWWRKKRFEFELFTSQLVLDEAARGEARMARRRLVTLRGISLLPTTEEVEKVALVLVERGFIPRRFVEDAYHVAYAVVHEIDFLLTWNCAHINNAFILRQIREYCTGLGFSFPDVCTPDSLMAIFPYEEPHS